MNIYCPVIWISHTLLNFAIFLISQIWLLRSTVRILACHAEDRGSTPLEAANALYGLKDRTNQASEATIMLKSIRLLIKVNPPLCRKTNVFVVLIVRQIICQLSL